MVFCELRPNTAGELASLVFDWSFLSREDMKFNSGLFPMTADFPVFFSFPFRRVLLELATPLFSLLRLIACLARG